MAKSDSLQPCQFRMLSLKKIILVALIGFGAWNYYTENRDSTPNPTPRTSGIAEIRREAPVQNFQTSFRCDGRQHCSQMTSRAEAEFFIRNCPNTKMDGDRDGIPCENDSRF
ncbi:excalibur calcium-binding domain-containing protein [uncultured Marinobacter sp.]|uniref:excalibur calcium-binding domain-containing protein n=1 Tax=uncultured Marinobacter sp. TaxID=187379 RepID=UPI00344B7A97